MSENPAPGWYADPTPGSTKMRYWDGTQWTEQYSDAPGAAPTATYAQPAAQQYTATPNYTYNQPAAAAQPSVKSTLAFAIPSLVSGGIAFICLCMAYLVVPGWIGLLFAIAGLVLGMMANKKVKSGLATAGVIVNLIMLILCLIFAIACTACVGCGACSFYY